MKKRVKKLLLNRIASYRKRKRQHSKRGTDLEGFNTENASQEDVKDLSCIEEILNVNNTATKVGFE